MSILDALHSDARILVGYAFEADGGLRLGVDATSGGMPLHTHVIPDGAAEVAAAFQGRHGHIIERIPNEHLCDCPGPRVNGRWPAMVTEQDPDVTIALGEAGAGATS